MHYFQQYYFSPDDQETVLKLQPVVETTPEAVQLIDAGFQRGITQTLQKCSRDAKIGVLLSGGVDSSLLLAMLRQLTDKQIVCFTALTTETDPDAQPSKDVCALLGIRWIPCHLTTADLSNRLNRLLPITGGGLYGTAFNLALDVCLEQCAQTGINNVLMGNGLDMFFGGGVDPESFKVTANHSLHDLFWKQAFDLLKERFYSQDGDDINKVAAPYHARVLMPFENLDIIRRARAIPAALLFQHDQDKYPVRVLAAQYGIPLPIAHRPKEILQRSSGIFGLLRDYMYGMLPAITHDAVNFKLSEQHFRADPNTDLQTFLLLLAERQRKQIT